MDTLVSILLFLLVFFIIVVSHEFGHFIVAKANGVRVIEFAIGMGPKLVGFSRNGTRYVLRALPIGGACVYDTGLEEALDEVMSDDKASEGMASAKALGKTGDNAGDDKGFLDEMQGIAYTEAPLMARIGIVLAGPVFNFIVAYLLALIVVWYTGSSNAEITSVMDGYPAQEAGLMAGDMYEMNIRSVSASERLFTISSVSLPSSSIAARTSSLRFSRLRR